MDPHVVELGADAVLHPLAQLRRQRLPGVLRLQRGIDVRERVGAGIAIRRRLDATGRVRVDAPADRGAVDSLDGRSGGPDARRGCCGPRSAAGAERIRRGVPVVRRRRCGGGSAVGSHGREGRGGAVSGRGGSSACVGRSSACRVTGCARGARRTGASSAYRRRAALEIGAFVSRILGPLFADDRLCVRLLGGLRLDAVRGGGRLLVAPGPGVGAVVVLGGGMLRRLRRGSAQAGRDRGAVTAGSERRAGVVAPRERIVRRRHACGHRRRGPRRKLVVAAGARSGFRRCSSQPAVVAGGTRVRRGSDPRELEPRQAARGGARGAVASARRCRRSRGRLDGAQLARERALADAADAAAAIAVVAGA
ncbi:MAG TPA: hypothetical protein VK607_27725 [Kofleriaceae bacterium]|nr:hypothetical protein [Kofleriaceae bacterium]